MNPWTWETWDVGGHKLKNHIRQHLAHEKIICDENNDEKASTKEITKAKEDLRMLIVRTSWQIEHRCRDGWWSASSKEVDYVGLSLK